MAVIFISNVVPDNEQYRTSAFTRSGNNVLTGISESFPNSKDYILLSCRPVASFPKGKLWYKKEIAHLDSGHKVLMLPTLNLKIIKNLFWGIYCFAYIICHYLNNRFDKSKVLVYNIYTPPISFLYWACKFSKMQLFAILYDLGIPPQRLGLSKVSMLGYRYMEKIAKKYIPLLDGRIVINEQIINFYSPEKNMLLIDGAVSDRVVNSLSTLTESVSDKYVFVCAGLLWDQNGTRIILDMLDKYPQLDIKIYFAGVGNDVPLIKEKALSDTRVEYCGMLDMDNLFRLYSSADVLLNIRIEEEIDFHFPSKLFEYMATGKCVLSTPIAHAERDYADYISFLTDISSDGLAQKIYEIMGVGKHELFIRGEKTREYILKNRRWRNRVTEILKYMNED